MAPKQLSPAKRKAENEGRSGQQRLSVGRATKPVRSGHAGRSQQLPRLPPPASAAAWLQLLPPAYAPCDLQLFPLSLQGVSTRGSVKPSREVQLLGIKMDGGKAIVGTDGPRARRGLGVLPSTPSPANARTPEAKQQQARDLTKTPTTAKGAATAAKAKGAATATKATAAAPTAAKPTAKAAKGKAAAAKAKSGRRLHLSEATVDDETFRVGDSVYVVMDTSLVADLE